MPHFTVTWIYETNAEIPEQAAEYAYDFIHQIPNQRFNVVNDDTNHRYFVTINLNKNYETT